jgi:tetratricopeptide (TPR) repeat protein
MRSILSGAIVLSLLLPSFAQEAAPQGEQPACYQDRSVDDYIVELNKLKTKHGTHNPLPNDVCIFGLCSHPPGGPDVNHPDPNPPAPQPQSDKQPSDRPVLNERESTSKTAVTGLAESTYDPVGAAEDTDVGDYYYGQKNYRAALMRYESAVEKKPGDAAIHLRIGRAFEKLGDNERAYMGYDSTVKLEPAGKRAVEAKQGMERLRPLLEKANVAPSGISATNEPPKAPCLAPPQPNQ